jgi:hypothetical protein
LSWTDSFTGEVLPNLDLKNTILTYTKDFSRKKYPNLPDFEGKKISNCQIFMISSSR